MSDPQAPEVAQAPESQTVTDANAPSAEAVNQAGSEAPAGSGPISLARIRELRKSQEQAQSKQKDRPPRRDPRDRPPRQADPAAESNSESGDATAADATKPQGNEQGGNQKGGNQKGGKRFQGRDKRGQRDSGVIADPIGVAPKVEVPSRRHPLSQDLEAEIDAALEGGDLDKMLIGDSMLQLSATLDEGQRVQATVVKVHGEHVFVTLGGPNEGMIPKLQFEDNLPAIGAKFEVIVRGFLPQEGLYDLTKPGNAISVADWSDLREGEVIEVMVSAANTGGLECKVGAVRGFIPASQVAEYRVENMADFVGQKVLCVVTEARVAVIWYFHVARYWNVKKQKSGNSVWRTWKSALQSKALFARSWILVHLLTSAASMACCTSANFLGNASSIQAKF
jgi:hypothetical protein